MKIITLTLNPAYDIHCDIDNFKPYCENLANITDFEAGGKGINISRALTAYGIKNTAITVLCKENSEAFKNALLQDKIDYLEISVDGRIRENITIHTKNADETRISFSGFSADDELINAFDNALNKMEYKNAIITFTGRIPKGISIDKAKGFIKNLINNGAKVVIDSKSFSLSDILEMKPWLIKPNQEEISEYLNKDISKFDDVIAAAKQLQQAGIENVMISLGKQGALLASNEGVYIATPPAITAISTIGAGDSTIAGFIAAESQNKTDSDKLITAVAYGTAACMTSGTKPPRPKDISHLINKITLIELES